MGIEEVVKSLEIVNDINEKSLEELGEKYLSNEETF